MASWPGTLGLGLSLRHYPTVLVVTIKNRAGMRGFKSNAKLWAGGALLLASAFAFKHVLWSVMEKDIRKNRDEEHEKASRALQLVHATAKRYALDTLTEEQVAALKKRRESVDKDGSK